MYVCVSVCVYTQNNEVKQTNKLLERLDEWLQMPMFAIPEDPALHQVFLSRKQAAALITLAHFVLHGGLCK